MSSGVLTRWPITREIVVTADDIELDGVPKDEALQRWLAQVWHAYLERCPRLTDEMRSGRVRFDNRPLRVGTRRKVALGETLLVAIATTELRPSALEVAVRVRALGSDARLVADGRWSLLLLKNANSTATVLPDQVQRELIALEAGASEYC